MARKQRYRLATIILLLNGLIVILGFSLHTGIANQAMQEEATPIDTLVTNTDYPAEGTGCLASGCHQGIEPIRQHDSRMAQQIYEKGMVAGDPNGCVVCHFGNPSEEKIKSLAHKDMIRNPASMWAIDLTCGQCHKDHCSNMSKNLMQTEAGKIQGALWGWGAQTGYKAVYGNYDLTDSDGSEPNIGTEEYKKYILHMKEMNEGSFPDSLKMLPAADMATLSDDPKQAVLTYLRGECQRCHVGVSGAKRRGDYHGMGCAACHIPYSDEGFYEGNDKSIPKHSPGHLMVHSIQSSRKTKVTVNNHTYSGIASETCTSCHNRGKRIGVSYLGIIEQPYDTPFGTDGKGQPKLHGKRYAYISDDAHHKIDSRTGNPKGGLLCQDCHNTTAMHGNGNIGSTTLGEVEVECSDCHGTPDNYPWELPLGFGDEFVSNDYNQARGLETKLLDIQKKFSTVYPAEDGYLLSARGNPFGNVVRRGNAVIVHSASGKDYEVPTLKRLTINNEWENPRKACTAMINIKDHLKNMECYSCHATWAAQCYGCHVKVDYSGGKTSGDWIKSGNLHFKNGETVESKKWGYMLKQPGAVTEGRSYIRWEDPILGVNGEGRVSPIIPGCQQITTVIDEKGETVVNNKIWRTPPGMENGGDEGQRGIDMSPAQPHTISKRARECTSCHTNPKTLGYGIQGGIFMNGYDSVRYMDMHDAQGQLISKLSTPQFNKIEDLDIDLSQVVTRDGKQVQTVGHHWELSGPLSKEQRDKMERVGVCISCHQDLPKGNFQISLMTRLAGLFGLTPYSDDDHMDLLNSDIKLAANTRIFAPVVVLVLLIVFFYFRKKKKKEGNYYIMR